MDDSLHLYIDVDNTTLGDYKMAKGSLLDAATFYIDWEKLHEGAPDAISPPGRILLQIANNLPR